MKKFFIGLLLLIMTGCGQSNDNNLVVYNNEIDIQPGLIENNLGGLDLSSVTQVQNKLDEGWETYTDEKLGYSIAYPIIWKDKLKKEEDPNIVASVTWLLDWVPEKVNEYTSTWNIAENGDKKAYAVVTYKVSVMENKLNLATAQLFEKIVREKLNPVDLFDACWINQKIDEDWLENSAVMIGGVEAVKIDWMTCPPGAGGKREIVIATKDKVYLIDMFVTSSGGGEGKEWEMVFEKFYQTFRLI